MEHVTIRYFRKFEQVPCHQKARHCIPRAVLCRPQQMRVDVAAELNTSFLQAYLAFLDSTSTMGCSTGRELATLDT